MERTCTNYVRELLTQNTDLTVYTKEFGSKHGYVDPESWMMSVNSDMRAFYENNYARFLICVKDPYHWLVSIKRYCEKQPGYIPYDPPRLLKRFNDMYLHWHRELIEKQHRFFREGWIVRYEELLINPACTLKLNEDYKEITRVRHSEQFTPERRQYYLNPITDQETIRLVNEYLTDEFFVKYGYQQNH